MRATIPDRTYGGVVLVQIPKISVHRLLVASVPVPRGTDTRYPVVLRYSTVQYRYRLLRPTYDTRRAAPCSDTCMDALRTHYGTTVPVPGWRASDPTITLLRRYVVDVQRKFSFKNSVTLFNTTSPFKKRRSEAGTNVLKRATQPGFGYHKADPSRRTPATFGGQ